MKTVFKRRMLFVFLALSASMLTYCGRSPGLPVSTDSPERNAAPQKETALKHAETTCPRIAVNGDGNSGEIDPDVASKIRIAGGCPIRIHANTSVNVADFDGLILVGGPDIDPERYGETPHPKTEMMSKAREQFDFSIAKKALDAQLPILGICLGAQELWVLLGGTLIQDIPSEIGDIVDHRARSEGHVIRVEENTLLKNVYMMDTFNVYSDHHQALDEKTIPANAIVSARALDGTIEAFELQKTGQFVMGLPWHPEKMEEGQKVFDAFVDASKQSLRAP